MSRGFSAVGLFRPKTPANVGAALRAVDVYGAALMAIEGARSGSIGATTNTTRTERRVPVQFPRTLEEARPYNCEVVVVDLIPGAKPLPSFEHPARAFYWFGPEDGTLGARHVEHAQHVVYIPGNSCMNLAATVNVVLYDRMVKRGEWLDRPTRMNWEG